MLFWDEFNIPEELPQCDYNRPAPRQMWMFGLKEWLGLVLSCPLVAAVIHPSWPQTPVPVGSGLGSYHNSGVKGVHPKQGAAAAGRKEQRESPPVCAFQRGPRNVAGLLQQTLPRLCHVTGARGGDGRRGTLEPSLTQDGKVTFTVSK